jgi:hypothetical protein
MIAMVLNGKTLIFFRIFTILKAHLTSFLVRFIVIAP